MNGIPLFEQSDARDALKKRCREAKISIRLLEDLVEAVREQTFGKERARGLFDKFDHLLDPPSGDDGSEGGD
jgi:hypothetical protein